MKLNKIVIAVVMSTYNGEKYLREQIDSILEQRGVEVKLFVRDDGSWDATTTIINEYAINYPNIVFWNKDNKKNIGVRDSFLTLLKDIYDFESDIQYFAFADQDDVWKADKLAAAVKMIQERNSDKDKPTLYYSNKTFVDSKLQFISNEHIRYYDDFFELLTQNKAFGCTMVMNRAAVQLVARVMPVQESFYHDVWVYNVAKICGAFVLFDEKSYILYRQHENNFCGKAGTKEIRFTKGIMRIFTKSRHSLQKQIQEISKRYDADVNPEIQKYIELVLNYDKNFSAWWQLATSPLMKKRGIVLQCLWLVRLILQKI